MEFFISGKKVGLRPMEITDIEKIAAWMNDSEVTRFMFYGRYPSTTEQIRELFEGYINNNEDIIFMIVDIATGLPIGFVGIFEIDFINRKGEFRILIGERKFWNSEYGMEVSAIVIHYGFDVLNLNKIYGGVSRPDNRGAKKFYELLGFKVEEFQRKTAYRNSMYYDDIKIDILRSEYYPKILKLYQKNFGIGTKSYE